MIDFTDKELKYLHDVLGSDIEDSTSKLDEIVRNECKEVTRVAVFSGLYSSLLNCTETGLTAMKKIVLALDEDGLTQEELREIDRAMRVVKENRKYLAKRGLL